MTKSIIFLLIFNSITFVINNSFYISPVRITNNCLEKELYTSCGSACDLTCENITVGTDKPNYEPYVVLDEPCRYGCIPGCYCKKPYYRNRFGQCVDENECRKSLDQNDFIERMNKFLNLYFDDRKTKSNIQDTHMKTNQPYIPVNGNSESIVDSKTTYSKKAAHQTLLSIDDNYEDFFNFDKNFFNNFFNDIFSHHSVNPQTTNYDTHYQNIDNSNLNVNDVNNLEKQIEKEADIILQKIKNFDFNLKIKKFIIDTLRSLINRSQYHIGYLPSTNTVLYNNRKDERNGLITT